MSLQEQGDAILEGLPKEYEASVTSIKARSQKMNAPFAGCGW